MSRSRRRFAALFGSEYASKPESCVRLSHPEVSQLSPSNRTTQRLSAQPSTGLIGDYQNDAALVRRDLRRCNFVCLYIFCNGQVGNNCERLFRCSQNNCERPLYRHSDRGASRTRTRHRCVPEPKQETTLHHGESSHGRHHRWGGVDV